MSRPIQTCVLRVRAGLPLTREEYDMVDAWATRRLRQQRMLPKLATAVVLMVFAGTWLFLGGVRG